MIKKRYKDSRDVNAINAHFRRSGPMKDLKKETSKNSCRNFDADNSEHEGFHEEEILSSWCEWMSYEYKDEDRCYCSKYNLIRYIKKYSEDNFETKKENCIEI